MLARSNSVSFVKILRFSRDLYNIRYFKHDLRKKKCLCYSIFPGQMHRILMTSCFVHNLPTTKGWKTLARDGNKENIQEKQFLSCEEGTDAVHHHVLMSQLQDCNTVSDQIKTFCSSISITSKEIENRKEFCKSLAEIFRHYFPECKIHLFGSTMNGLGFKGCDADVSIQTIFDGKECLTNIKEVPTLDSVIKGEISADTVAHLPPPLLLRFIRRILRAHCCDVREPVLFIKARCPLLRFYNAKYDVFCDFSCENYASLRNTKLIRLLCHLDERFSALAKVIRYWGKYGGFVGDIDLFNSYAFSLLVVHFLQLRDPPVLPSIKELIEMSEYLTHGDLNDDELLVSDLKKFRPSQNSQTVEELLREYFFHYLTFDYSQMMVPVTSSIMPKADFIPKNEGSSDNFEFSTVTVQDPFRPNFNVTAAALHGTCRRFLSGLIEACKVYQDENMWHPNVDKWGICTLFQRTLSDHKMYKKSHKSFTHSFKLPLETDVSLLQKILQEGLLFDCSELTIQNTSEVPQPILRLDCKVYYNTWIGRYCIYANCPNSLTNHLEIENWVSNQMLEKSRGNRKQLLLTFLCECFENTCDNKLNVFLTFREFKYPPVVAIFLKEYIPSLCKKLCKS